MAAEEMRAKIMEIMRDPNLSEQEKALKRQALMSGQWSKPAAQDAKPMSPGNNGAPAAAPPFHAPLMSSWG